MDVTSYMSKIALLLLKTQYIHAAVFEAGVICTHGLHTYASDILNIMKLSTRKWHLIHKPIWGLMLMIIRSTWTKFR